MRTLVFGKNGQVARALSCMASGADEFIFLGRDQADLMSAGAARDAIAEYHPDAVINAAAYTAVDNAESDKDSAHRLNAGAVAEMAAACANINVHFIHVSTDYVFDGNGDERLTETARAKPLNVYGKTKLDGEVAALDANPGVIILRTSWVFSEYGSNFVKTMLRLAKDKSELSIVSDQIGGPTDAHDIASALLAIAGKKNRGGPGAGVYHFQGAPAVSWADFAMKIFEIAGATITINKIKTSEYPTPARRPLNSILDCAKLERDFGIGQPDWRIGLRRVMAALNK
jgi:dTDP-4-dehydrorhamnose reductase